MQELLRCQDSDDDFWNDHQTTHDRWLDAQDERRIQELRDSADDHLRASNERTWPALREGLNGNFGDMIEEIAEGIKEYIEYHRDSRGANSIECRPPEQRPDAN